MCAGPAGETSVAGGYKSSIEIVGTLLSHSLFFLFFFEIVRHSLYVSIIKVER